MLMLLLLPDSVQLLWCMEWVCNWINESGMSLDSHISHESGISKVSLDFPNISACCFTGNTPTFLIQIAMGSHMLMERATYIVIFYFSLF